MKNKNKKAGVLAEDEGPQQSQENERESRRAFLKKAVYSAPVLIVLGQMAYPDRAAAESRLPDPPFFSDPNRRFQE